MLPTPIRKKDTASAGWWEAGERPKTLFSRIGTHPSTPEPGKRLSAPLSFLGVSTGLLPIKRLNNGYGR